MRVAVLGPLQVIVDDRQVQLGGRRLRALVCRLALGAPAPVGIDELVDAVWGEDPPADASNALQALVSRVRRALGGPRTVLADGRGYRLALERDDVDVTQFRDLLERGRQAARRDETTTALDAFDAALALWRGPAAEEVAEAGFGQAMAAELDNLHLEAWAGRIDAALRLGGRKPW